MGSEDNMTCMDGINAFGYLSHGLCHEVTIGGVDASLSICDREDEHLYMSRESLADCRGQ